MITFTILMIHLRWSNCFSPNVAKDKVMRVKGPPARKNQAPEGPLDF